MEEMVTELMLAGIAVELLTARAADGKDFYGIRLRPFGRNLPRNKMIVAAGDTFTEALINAVEKAESRRWEALDWSTRPWGEITNNARNKFYGLDAPSASWSARNGAS